MIETLLSLMLSVSVTTARQNNYRTSANTAETILTPSSVVGGGFRKLRSLSVDGQVYAQVLYVPALTIGGALHDTAFVATLHNSVYAFDVRTGVQLWTTNLGTPMSTWPNKGIQNLIQGNELGILSTPVIDESASRMYVVASGSGTGGSATWVLWKLNLLTGATVDSVTVAGSVSGTGSGGSTVTFSAQNHLQRTALTLANGKVYIGMGSYSDLNTYWGWIFSYDTTTMTRSAVWNAAPNGTEGGIWQSSAGIAVDPNTGDLITMTGNGHWDGVTDFGVSFVRLNSSLVLQDWFTPANNSTLNSEDWDLASGVAIIDPDSSQVFGGAKSGVVFNLLRSNMGHLQGGAGLAPQSFLTKAATSGQVHTGIYGGMYMNSVLYQPWVGDKIYAFTKSSASVFNTTAVTSAASYNLPGAVMTGSSNGTNNQIIWATVADSGAMTSAVPGRLLALNSTTLAPIWSSADLGRDGLGTFVKFNAPTVADGMVMVGTQDNAVVVYGMASSTQYRGLSTSRGQVVVR